MSTDNLEPFDLDRARRGDAICFACGTPVKFVYWTDLTPCKVIVFYNGDLAIYYTTTIRMAPDQKWYGLYIDENGKPKLTYRYKSKSSLIDEWGHDELLMMFDIAELKRTKGKEVIK